MSDVVRAVIVVRSVPSARVLIGLHRVLTLGLADVRERIKAGHPILDAELFGNCHNDLAQVLEAVLGYLTDSSYTIHECVDADAPTPSNEITAEMLRRILVGHRVATSGSAPGVPDSVLTEAIADAARKAIVQLRSQTLGPFCAYALLTSGEALRPYLSVTSHGPGRWDLADSAFAVVGDEHFAPLGRIYAERGDLSDMASTDAEAEYGRRLASMEAALHVLDEEGLFGTGVDRARTLLLVSQMPPDESDAGFACRLNPPGELLDAWLEEAAEGC